MANLMQRRTGMIPPEWDIDWDYTQGLPTNNGWERIDTSSSNASQTLRETDVRIYVKSQSYNFTYSNPIRVDPVGVFEVDFMFTDNSNGIIYLANGVGPSFGVRPQYSANYKGIYLVNASGIASMTKVQSLSLNTRYKIRLESDGTYGYLYVNGVLKKSNIDLSTMYTTVNTNRFRISSASTSAGHTNVYSMRLRIGRI